MTQEVLVVSQTEVLVQQVGGETLVEQITTQEVVTEAQQGPPGPPGSGINDAHLVHDQQTAADTWEITHNLGKYPAVTVIDSAGDQVEGDLRYIGLNAVRISFGAAFSGRAFFN